MSDTATALQIGNLQGEVKFLGDQVRTLSDDVGDLKESTGRIEGMLRTMTGSGPQPVIRAGNHNATEPKTDSVVSKAMALAGKPIAIHALYLGAILVILLLIAIWQSGRPVSDFVPGTHSRSGIGPINEERP